MKIHFDGCNFSSSTGPNTFATRLAKKLIESGHDLLLEGQDADVSLVFIEPTGEPLAKKIVQRLDGIWSRPQDFHTKNFGIKRLYQIADAIVWQSDFDRLMTSKWWGIPGRGHGQIIRNGIELKPIKQLTIPKLIEMRAAYDQIFVCSANWHAQKRLSANVKLFEHIRKIQHSNSCLIILGSNPDYRIANPHVFYAGSVQPEVYMEIYSAANWMLHCAYGDHCPNTIVECLSQGTPVVCSEVGGTKELIGDFGIILKEQNPYNFELYDYDHPPEIDVVQCQQLPTRQELDYSTVANIDINHATEQYLKLFESLI